MILELIKSPFGTHNNKLFEFIKLSLTNIYGNTADDFPYSDKAKKFQLKLSGCDVYVKIRVNDNDYLVFDGSASSTHEFTFYFVPTLGNNLIEVVDVNNQQLYAHKNIFCLNTHIFLGYVAKKFKEIQNQLFQAQANTYIDKNKVQDLDGNNLIPEKTYLNNFAVLLGTKRYSKFTDDEYYLFLHKILEANTYGGLWNSLYKLQEALPNFIKRIDVIPVEKYFLKSDKILAGKVYQDGTNSIKIYPAYVFQENQDWGILPYVSGTKSNSLVVPQGWDTTNIQDQINLPIQKDWLNWVYTDGDISGNDSTNYGMLKVKSLGVPSLYNVNFDYTDTFTNSQIYTDELGEYTGFIGNKFVALTKPLVDGTIKYVVSSGKVKVDNSYKLIPDYNLIDLGTTLDSTNIDSINITYKTYDNYNVLGKINRAKTSGHITSVYSGHVDIDAVNMSYQDYNYGSVIISINTKTLIDPELKEILNNLIRNLLPVHISYYIKWINPETYFLSGDSTISIGEISNIYGDITWTTITSGTTENLNDVYFISSLIGWAVGDNGTILYTANGGTTWNAQDSGTVENLNKVRFISKITGIAVGENGTILKTTDGGVTWDIISSGTSEDLKSLVIIPSLTYREGYTIYIVGTSNIILKSVDTGNTFSDISIDSDTNTNYSDIEILNEKIGIIIGEAGFIISTNDGFNTILVHTSGTTKNLKSVSLLRYDTAIVTGETGLILKSSNLNFDGDVDSDIITNTWQTLSPPEIVNFNNSYFISTNKGYLIGDSGKVSKTTDSGVTWNTIKSTDTNQLNANYIFDNKKMILVGNTGKIYSIAHQYIYHNDS